MEMPVRLNLMPSSLSLSVHLHRSRGKSFLEIMIAPHTPERYFLLYEIQVFQNNDQSGPFHGLRNPQFLPALWGS